MSKNISSVVGDDVYDLLEKERMKRGVLKSKAVDMLLRETLIKEKDVSKIDSIIDDKNKNAELIKEMENIVLDNEKLLEKTQKIKDDERKKLKDVPSEPKKEDSKPSLDLVPNITNIEPPKLNLTGSSYTEIPSTPILDSLVAKPIVDKPIEKPIDLNIKEIPQKPRYVIKKKVNRVTEDEGQQPIDVEKKYRELREKDKFNETFSDIHNRIKNIDDRVCKDGECTKKELENIKNEIGKLEGLKKNLDTSTSELTNLRKDLTDLKKDLPKLDVCPECGDKAVLHLSSFCSNCGSKMTGWTDDNGNNIPGWKPYWEKNKK